jgi:hypothetical protein
MSQQGVNNVIGGSPSIPTEFIADIGSAIPSGNQLEILTTIALAGTDPLLTTGSGNTITISSQYSQSLASADSTKVGLSNFDSAAFAVDADGFVTLIGGGGAMTELGVDASTPPGTDPVVAAGGVITLTGAQVAAGVVGANVIRTNSVAANTATIEIQRTAAVASTDSTQNGVAHFDSSSFSVDANGFVTLAGGGLAIDSITPNSGTSPIVPDGAGNVTLVGSGSITNVGSLNTGTFQLTGLTNHAVQIGAGTDTLTQSNVGTDGQVFLGATGADPAFATLTSTGATITFTPGANSLNLETDGSVATSYLCDNAASAVPAAGVLTVTGGTTAAGTSPLVTSGAGSTVTINAQISQAIASTDATKIGLCNFDSGSFAVDANGFVTTSGTGIANTITGDTGGALSPTAGNWNIIGSEDISTSGSVSTLTINQAVNYKLSFMFGGM